MRGDIIVANLIQVLKLGSLRVRSRKPISSNFSRSTEFFAENENYKKFVLSIKPIYDHKMKGLEGCFTSADISLASLVVHVGIKLRWIIRLPF